MVTLPQLKPETRKSSVAIDELLVRIYDKELAEATDPKDLARLSARRDSVILGPNGRASARYADRLFWIKSHEEDLAEAQRQGDQDDVEYHQSALTALNTMKYPECLAVINRLASVRDYKKALAEAHRGLKSAVQKVDRCEEGLKKSEASLLATTQELIRPAKKTPAPTQTSTSVSQPPGRIDPRASQPHGTTGPISLTRKRG